MKKRIVFGLLLLKCISSFSQNLDLVVNAKGDSIECKIDSISDSAIYFKLKTHGSNKWMHTFYEKQNIASYNYNCIDPSEVSFKKGTSIVNNDSQHSTDYPKKFPDKATLENASADELDFYLVNAKKTKKIGAIMSIAGPIAFGSGILMANSAWSGGTEAMWGLAIILGMAGTASTIMGLPVFFTGTSRVNRIKKIQNSKSNEVTIELVPCNFENYQAQKLQPRVTLRIKF